MSSTGFLAALFHGIVILGISFGSTGARQPADAPSTLEVVLVTADDEDPLPTQSAVLLAQTTRSGAGNAPADATLLTAPGSRLRASMPGPDQMGSSDGGPGDFEPFRDAKPILTADDSSRMTANRSNAGRRQAEQHALPDSGVPLDVIGRDSNETLIPDAEVREFLISANARESRIAAYLNIWKRKVEQTGTLNFPRVARHTQSIGHPVLEVAVNADGSLRDVVVRTSSGERSLDQAAMDILRLASPFEPFPEALRSHHDVLRFAYEWRFSEGPALVRASASAR